MSRIFCIQIVGGSLNLELQEALFNGAEEILKKRSKDTAKIKGDGFEGRVKTDWKVGRISAVFGTIFKVTIEMERSKIVGSFIAHSRYDEALGKRPQRIESN